MAPFEFGRLSSRPTRILLAEIRSIRRWRVGSSVILFFFFWSVFFFEVGFFSHGVLHPIRVPPLPSSGVGRFLSDSQLDPPALGSWRRAGFFPPHARPLPEGGSLLAVFRRPSSRHPSLSGAASPDLFRAIHRSIPPLLLFGLHHVTPRVDSLLPFSCPNSPSRSGLNQS